jgi:hypothetical protein
MTDGISVKWWKAISGKSKSVLGFLLLNQ